MSELICLDERYSTTRMLNNPRPNIKSNVENQNSLFCPVGGESQGEGGLRKCGYFKTSLPNQPLITVVTVVFNGAKYLEETIQSVINQTYSNIEYIIIDGGSTDGTLDVLYSFDNQLDYWVSEPDAGIYDAMNKAIELARGQFIYHLNIGDQLLCIPVLFEESELKEVICIAGVVQTSANSFHIPSVDLRLRFHNTLHHQGCFYRKTSNLFYDIHYKIFSDFDLNQRLLNDGGKFILCSDVVAIHDVGGVSHTTNRFFEVYSIVLKNFGPWWAVVCFAYFKYRGLLKRLQII